MSKLVNLDELLSKFELMNTTQPQKGALGQNAIGAIRSGLATLSALGYRFAVSELEPDELKGDEFPKMFYHQVEGEKTVHSADEASKLGPGWSETPQGGGEAAKPVDAPAATVAPPAASPAPANA